MEMRLCENSRHVSDIVSKPVHRNQDTYVAIVLAADGGSVASVAGADTDDTDWGAVEADVAIEVGEDNAQGTEQAGLRGGLSLMSRDRI